MRKYLNILAMTIAMIGLSSIHYSANAENFSQSGTGPKGARIYCFMRNNGNDHEVSWDAAYSLIKRQTNSLFKTSPKHAAVMIVESVVQNPNDYENCGSYLGDLFGSENVNNSFVSEEDLNNENKIEMEPKLENKSKSNLKDRYNY
tara:strand:+ start:380 stop:817 length:438 start_codon:yes stop_codon:yes gene_type:complete